jgi:RNA polymerase sigma-70 factor (ECF subfamily)
MSPSKRSARSVWWRSAPQVIRWCPANLWRIASVGFRLLLGVVAQGSLGGASMVDGGMEAVPCSTGFDEFVVGAEPSLRRALMASFGPTVSWDATVDSMSWAWEHWDRLRRMSNPIGYLYRVGQTAARRYRPARPSDLLAGSGVVEPTGFSPELLPALARLSVQKRSSVVLIHSYGMTQREVAEILDVSVSTVRAQQYLLKSATVSVKLSTQLCRIQRYAQPRCPGILLGYESPRRPPLRRRPRYRSKAVYEHPRQPCIMRRWSYPLGPSPSGNDLMLFERLTARASLTVDSTEPTSQACCRHENGRSGV